MPTYDFECSKCHHRFEERRSFSDNKGAVCPQCRGKARRLISAPPIIFKGSGFYVTDHRKADPSDNGGSTKTETKTEAKPEPKKEAKTESKSAATTVDK